MSGWSLRLFRQAAARWLDELPPRLLEGLNGGVLIRREARRRPEDPPGVYLLGEYVVEPGVGRMIIIYYGSFRLTLAGEPWERVEKELRRTLRHELQHHLEHLAGLADLEREDEAQRSVWWEEWRRSDRREVGQRGAAQGADRGRFRFRRRGRHPS